MTATLLGKIAVCIGQAFVAAYYYGRVLCTEKTFRRVWIVLGALLALFGIAYQMQPAWYYLSSQADPLASSCFAAAEAAAVVFALRLLTRRHLPEILLFFCLRILMATVAALLPFSLFALFTGESVARLVATEWNDLLFSLVSAVLDMGLLIAAAEAISSYVRKQTVELRWGQFAPVIGAQAVSLALMALLWRDGGLARALAVLAVLTVIYAIADAVLLGSFRAFVKNSELERSVDDLLRQQALQKNYYLSLNEQLKSAQRMRHDYRNTLQTIDALMARGETEKARSFASECSAALSSGAITAYTGNEILDAVLNNKADLARRGKTAFDIQLVLPNPLNISDLDLMSVFSNLLDNALEYVSGLPEEERRVAVEGEVRAGQWVVRFLNAYRGAEPPSFQTTKTEKNLHGLGMGIVQSVLNKYDGTIATHVKDGMLQMTVVFNAAFNKTSE